MRVLYHIPSLYSIYAQRTIYNGFKNAFLSMGHDFRPLTSDDTPAEVFSSYQPNLFITSSFHWYRKYLDYRILKKFRDNGMFTLVKIDFWNSAFSSKRLNEAPALKGDIEAIRLIREGLMGDAYFHVVEQGDPRMDGFERETGNKYYTIPLAADSTILSPMYDKKYSSDVSFIGTYLPEKRDYFKDFVYPLNDKYILKLYGQDWTKRDRLVGWTQRVGQYFNIPYIRSIRKPRLQLEDEAKIYTSSIVSINVHESHQKIFGGDCNERTFKIPICGGFQIVDNVACIAKYLKPDHEIVMAKDNNEWVDKIHYYLKNPDERLSIIEAGRRRILGEHTYQHRASRILSILSNSGYCHV